MKTKVCKRCKEKKEVNLFRSSKFADGYVAICKKCNAKLEKIYKENNKERAREVYIKSRENRFEHNFLLGIKNRAKKRGFEFNLTIEDIVFPEYCPYLNIKLTKNVCQGRFKSNISTDRVDNTKGYIKGNIMIISDLANRMKQNATIEELIIFSKNVLNMYNI